MLKETQGVEVTLAELKAAGEADLARNLAALEAAVRRLRARHEHERLRG